MKTYYHVTFIENFAKMYYDGIVPQKRQIWSSKLKRSLGKKGVVYAFGNLNEAIIWAARMEWHFNRPIEQIVIIPFSGNGIHKDMNLQMQLDYPSASFKYGIVPVEKLKPPLKITREMVREAIKQR